MEFVIPGLILVALMAWASTRIKRSAAAAFDAETIETDEFRIHKPEGFLHVLNDNSGLAFRAYSKDFGSVGRKDVRQATIEIEVHRDTSIDNVRKEIKAASEAIASIEPYVDGGEKATFVRSTGIVDGREYSVMQKLVTRGTKVFDVRAKILSGHEDDQSDKIETMLDTVQIK